MADQTKPKVTSKKRLENEQAYVLTKEQTHAIIAAHLESSVIKGKAKVLRLQQRGSEITVTYIHEN